MVSLEENTDCVVHLNTSDIVGLAFIAESGVISSVAVLIFALLVVRNVIQTRRHPGPHRVTPLIKTHVDGYMLSLMLADLLQGLGAVTSAKWAAQGKVECGNYCVAQGAIQQLGETGVAMSTLVITIHTFATVFFRWEPRNHPWVWVLVVTCIWTFLLLFVVIGYAVHIDAEGRGGTPYFGPTPFWCWIGSHYAAERIAGEYFWLWACALISIVLYLILFFRLRGNIDVDPDNWKRISFHRRNQAGIFGKPSIPAPKNQHHLEQEREVNKEAMKMFWYPISYIILYGPLSINRWTSSSKSSVNTGVEQLSIVPTSVVLFIFGLSGLVNVLLFFLTRPKLLLFNIHRQLKCERLEAQPLLQTAEGIHPRTKRRKDDEGEDRIEGILENSQQRVRYLGVPSPQTTLLPPRPGTSLEAPPNDELDIVDGAVEMVRTHHHNPGGESSTTARTRGETAIDVRKAYAFAVGDGGAPSHIGPPTRRDLLSLGKSNAPVAALGKATSDSSTERLLISPEDTIQSGGMGYEHKRLSTAKIYAKLYNSGAQKLNHWKKTPQVDGSASTLEATRSERLTNDKALASELIQSINQVLAILQTPLEVSPHP